MRTPKLRELYIQTLNGYIERCEKRVKEATDELNSYKDKLKNIDVYEPEDLLYEVKYCDECGKKGDYRYCCYQGHF